MTGLEVGRFGSLEIGWVLARGRVFFRSWLLGRRPTCCVFVCACVFCCKFLFRFLLLNEIKRNSPAFSRKK
jgi:hypothetical protein